jgi:hypothetical protein
MIIFIRVCIIITLLVITSIVLGPIGVKLYSGNCNTYQINIHSNNNNVPHLTNNSPDGRYAMAGSASKC